ncbi:hypothetical protein I4U23_004916 [Adineta vaga]|nr:hypothetical protein I4U23_004916 [Adineta vaga]
MRTVKSCFLLLILNIIDHSLQNQAFQSIITVEQQGTDFIPANPIEFIANYSDRSTLMSCYHLCNRNPLCRTFISDSTYPFACRLYQGTINTGTVVISPSVTSQVASLHYDASFYTNYNQTCDENAPPVDRYLVCIHELYRCPSGTYWNGKICLNQVYYGNSCSSVDMCRQDIGLTCLSCGTCYCPSTAIWNGTSCVPSDIKTSPSLLPISPNLTALWLLDNNTDDLMNHFNGTLIGNASFVTGYVGQAIALTNNSYILLSYIDFYLRSFTIELWFYQLCLHVGLNTDLTLHFGFWDDDVNSLATLSLNQWHHVTFVYDYTLRQRFIYLNGVSVWLSISYLSGSHTYLGQTGITSFGKVIPFPDQYFGYIDHVSITHRAKTSNEILNDATLVAYYTFDTQSILDSGPNLLHGFAINHTYTTGRINDAIQLNSSFAYFQAFGFTALGMSNTSFSIALWIKPRRLNGSLIHLSTASNGTGSCETILGFSQSGNLIVQISNSSINGPIPILNIWTHITYTFNMNNDGPNIPVYMTLANRLLGINNCKSGNISDLSYEGAVDELRIYNREVTLAEICVLAS